MLRDALLSKEQETQVRIAYSDTTQVSKQAYVRKNPEGWVLLDDEATAGFDLPEDWEFGRIYAWDNEDATVRGEWQPGGENEYWLVILPA